MADVSIFIAFLAGLVSFLSPCILPLVPAFLAYLTGVTTSELNNDLEKRKQALANSLFFALGLVTVFTALGILLNSALSAISFELKNTLSQIGGLIIIFFGLVLLGVVKLDFLETQHKIKVKKTGNAYFSSFLFGASFAAGWTPCVSAVLGAILTLAITNPTQATPLLLAYSIGLAVPFIVTGLFVGQASAWIQKHAGALAHLKTITGALLVILGLLVLTGQINKFSNFEVIEQLTNVKP